MARIVATVLCVGLAACSHTVPVAVIGDKGDIMRGTATASLSGATFRVDGAGRRCAGSYNGYTESVTMSFPVTCSDGRKGLVIVTRDPCLCSGSGRVRLQDGTEWDFVFGKAAEAF